LKLESVWVRGTIVTISLPCVVPLQGDGEQMQTNTSAQEASEDEALA